jgi:xanthine dehydrogenase YagS FAD-binding subunit
MRTFDYARAVDLDSALAVLEDPRTVPVAGGTELLNWLKEEIVAPERLLDIRGLPLAGVESDEHGLRIGALARMSDVAAHPAVADGYPVLAESLLLAASAQLRNMATMGGNLVQRTRCPYFRADTSGADTPLPCNQRRPGSGCGALAGDSSGGAIFGWTPRCVATHPSDLAVALTALDASVEVRSASRGTRALPVAELFLLPTEDERHRHTALEPGELITAIRVPPASRHSRYLKVRERVSYEFAVVSAAAVLELSGREIVAARLAMGAVAYRPWRLPAAEAALRGTDVADSAAVRAAVDGAFADARPLPGNAFKVELARRSAVRVVQMAGGVR